MLLFRGEVGNGVGEGWVISRAVTFVGSHVFGLTPIKCLSHRTNQCQRREGAEGTQHHDEVARALGAGAAKWERVYVLLN